MKRSSALLAPCMAMAIFCALSCGQNKNSSQSAATSDSTSAASSSTTTSSTTVSTVPQLMMIVTHKVANYPKWKMNYEAHDSVRMSNGVHNYVIGRSLADSNNLLVAMKAEDIQKAKAFARDPRLLQSMHKGGVVGAPDIHFVTMVYQDTAQVASAIRSQTTFTVKDWGTWQRTFDSTRQTRKDNGLEDRAYGHDADDNHKVTLVVAVMDTARANAFWKSDALKKIQAASGVVSAPQRFLFRVVQRY